MPHRLFVVQEIYPLRNHGIVLMPGTEATDRVLIGQAIYLRRPDGRSASTSLSGIEMSERASADGCHPILLRGIDIGEVPNGTEVWTVD